jgi:xanthine dehydrogenase accessory factor
MNDWISALAQHREAGIPAVLVTMLTVRGSAPREAGTKMVVTAEDQAGSIGGGQLEFQALAIARDLLSQQGGPPPSPLVREFPLGPALGQCCGGSVEVLFEAMVPIGRPIAIFGAGHVGRALVRILGDLPCRVTWIDPREEEFPEALPANTRKVVGPLPTHDLADLHGGCAVLIMTHSHQLDLQLVEAALKRDDLSYVGVIGSATKRARFLQRLRQRGLSQGQIDRLTCPIGLPGIGGKHPTEIAISVAAQLIALPGAGLRHWAEPSTVTAL